MNSNDFISIWLLLHRPYLQMRSHSVVLLVELQHVMLGEQVHHLDPHDVYFCGSQVLPSVVDAEKAKKPPNHLAIMAMAYIFL